MRFLDARLPLLVLPLLLLLLPPRTTLVVVDDNYHYGKFKDDAVDCTIPQYASVGIGMEAVLEATAGFPFVVRFGSHPSRWPSYRDSEGASQQHGISPGQGTSTDFGTTTTSNNATSMSSQQFSVLSFLHRFGERPNHYHPRQSVQEGWHELQQDDAARLSLVGLHLTPQEQAEWDGIFWETAKAVESTFGHPNTQLGVIWGRFVRSFV